MSSPATRTRSKRKYSELTAAAAATVATIDDDDDDNMDTSELGDNLHAVGRDSDDEEYASSPKKEKVDTDPTRGEFEQPFHLPRPLTQPWLATVITTPQVYENTYFDLPLFVRRHKEVLNNVDYLLSKPGSTAAEDLAKLLSYESLVVEFYGGNFTELLNPGTHGRVWAEMAEFLRDDILPLVKEMCGSPTSYEDPPGEAKVDRIYQDTTTYPKAQAASDWSNSSEPKKRNMTAWCQKMQSDLDFIYKYQGLEPGSDANADRQDFSRLKIAYTELVTTGQGKLKGLAAPTATARPYYAVRYDMVEASLFKSPRSPIDSQFLYKLYFLAEVCCNVWDALHCCLTKLLNTALSDLLGSQGSATLPERLNWLNEFGCSRRMPFHSPLAAYETRLSYAEVSLAKAFEPAANGSEFMVLCPSVYSNVNATFPAIDMNRLLLLRGEDNPRALIAIAKMLLEPLRTYPYPLVSSSVVTLAQLRLMAVPYAFQSTHKMMMASIFSDEKLRKQIETVSVTVQEQGEMLLCPDFQPHPLTLGRANGDGGGGASEASAATTVPSDGDVEMVDLRDADATSPEDFIKEVKELLATTSSKSKNDKKKKKKEKKVQAAAIKPAEAARRKLEVLLDRDRNPYIPDGDEALTKVLHAHDENREEDIKNYKQDKIDYATPLTLAEVLAELNRIQSVHDIGKKITATGSGIAPFTKDDSITRNDLGEAYKTVAATSTPEGLISTGEYIRIAYFAKLSHQAISLALGAALLIADDLFESATSGPTKAQYATQREMVKGACRRIGARVTQAFQFMGSDNHAKNLVKRIERHAGRSLLEEAYNSAKGSKQATEADTAMNNLFESLNKTMRMETNANIRKDIARMMHCTIETSKYFIGTIYMCLEKTLHLLSCLPFYSRRLMESGNFAYLAGTSDVDRMREQLNVLFPAGSNEANYWALVYEPDETLNGLPYENSANEYYKHLKKCARYVDRHDMYPPVPGETNGKLISHTNSVKSLPYVVASLLSNTFDMLSTTVEEKEALKDLKEIREKADKNRTTSANQRPIADYVLADGTPMTDKEIAWTVRDNRSRYLDARFSLSYKNGEFSDGDHWDPRRYYPLDADAGRGGILDINEGATEDYNTPRFNLIKSRVDMFSRRFGDRGMVTAYLLYHLDKSNQLTNSSSIDPNASTFTLQLIFGIVQLASRFISPLWLNNEADRTTATASLVTTVINVYGANGWWKLSPKTVGMELVASVDSYRKYYTDPANITHLINGTAYANWDIFVSSQAVNIPNELSAILQNAQSTCNVFMQSSRAVGIPIAGQGEGPISIDVAEATVSAIVPSEIINAYPAYIALDHKLSGKSFDYANVGSILFRTASAMYSANCILYYVFDNLKWLKLNRDNEILPEGTNSKGDPIAGMNERHNSEYEKLEDTFQQTGLRLRNEGIGQMAASFEAVMFAVRGGSALGGSVFETAKIAFTAISGVVALVSTTVAVLSAMNLYSSTIAVFSPGAQNKAPLGQRLKSVGTSLLASIGFGSIASYSLWTSLLNLFRDGAKHILPTLEYLASGAMDALNRLVDVTKDGFDYAKSFGSSFISAVSGSWWPWGDSSSILDKPQTITEIFQAHIEEVKRDVEKLKGSVEFAAAFTEYAKLTLIFRTLAFAMAGLQTWTAHSSIQPGWSLRQRWWLQLASKGANIAYHGLNIAESVVIDLSAYQILYAAAPSVLGYSGLVLFAGLSIALGLLSWLIYQRKNLIDVERPALEDEGYAVFPSISV